MKHPIIVAAFGTTSRARTVYGLVDNRLKEHFPGHDIHWAFTSRIVRGHLKKHRIDTLSPAALVARLADRGHRWAVVQSLNMICGHEFHRLVSDVQNSRCRVSIGHSLLCSREDHQAVARALAPLFEKDEAEAIVLVGHGTDHCIWTAYPAFYQRLREMYGRRAYGGTIEADDPDREMLIDQIRKAGFRRVRLVPFMLVAGVHFEEDLTGPDDSWKMAFEGRGIDVVLEAEGLGMRTSIIDIFETHIADALSVIPENKSAPMAATICANVINV